MDRVLRFEDVKLEWREVISSWYDNVSNLIDKPEVLGDLGWIYTNNEKIKQWINDQNYLKEIKTLHALVLVFGMVNYHDIRNKTHEITTKPLLKEDDKIRLMKEFNISNIDEFIRKLKLYDLSDY